LKEEMMARYPVKFRANLDPEVRENLEKLLAGIPRDASYEDIFKRARREIKKMLRRAGRVITSIPAFSEYRTKILRPSGCWPELAVYNQRSSVRNLDALLPLADAAGEKTGTVELILDFSRTMSKEEGYPIFSYRAKGFGFPANLDDLLHEKKII